MTALTEFMSSSLPGRIRPYEPQRDLALVADLVELCFADTMDADGRSYLMQMRAIARNPAGLRWAGLAYAGSSLPLAGYVWEENNRLIANLTLIPFTLNGRRCFLIANVAVLPEYRRRGIARRLTTTALEHSRNQAAAAVWLHVRAENGGAIALYRSLGFAEIACRTTWHCPGDPFSGSGEGEIPTTPAQPGAAGLAVGGRSDADWPAQLTWLEQAYPRELTWHLSLRKIALRPGLLAGLYRFFNDLYVRQWSAQRGGRLAGVLAWQSSYGQADHLWLAIDPAGEAAGRNQAAAALLGYARRRLSPHRTLALDYPSGWAEEPLRSAGFIPHQTLMWMKVDLSPARSAAG
jgi:ribosomal protein S18 acetylase RimI-like enzyme